MTLSKKHYDLIANAICEARKVVERESGNSIIVNGANCGFYELAKILCNEFGMDNPRFDENKFMTATEVLYK
jgi:hypothetical protein